MPPGHSLSLAPTPICTAPSLLPATASRFAARVQIQPSNSISCALVTARPLLTGNENSSSAACETNCLKHQGSRHHYGESCLPDFSHPPKLGSGATTQPGYVSSSQARNSTILINTLRMHIGAGSELGPAQGLRKAPTDIERLQVLSLPHRPRPIRWHLRNRSHWFEAGGPGFVRALKPISGKWIA